MPCHQVSHITHVRLARHTTATDPRACHSGSPPPRRAGSRTAPEWTGAGPRPGQPRSRRMPAQPTPRTSRGVRPPRAPGRTQTPLRGATRRSPRTDEPGDGHLPSPPRPGRLDRPAAGFSPFTPGISLVCRDWGLRAVGREDAGLGHPSHRPGSEGAPRLPETSAPAWVGLTRTGRAATPREARWRWSRCCRSAQRAAAAPAPGQRPGCRGGSPPAPTAPPSP